MILNLHKGERVVAAENSRRQALDDTAKAKKKKEEEAQKIQAAGAARAAATLAAAKKKGTGVAGGSKATPHGNGTRPRTGAASSSSSSSSSSASSSSARSTAKGGKAKGRRRRWPSSASAGAGADADAFPDENQTLDQHQKQLAAKQSASPTFTSTPALSNPPLSPISRKQVKPKARRSGSGSTPTAADKAAGENEFDEYPWFFLARENDTLEIVASECAIDRGKRIALSRSRTLSLLHALANPPPPSLSLSLSPSLSPPLSPPHLCRLRTHAPPTSPPLFFSFKSFPVLVDYYQIDVILPSKKHETQP